MPFADDASGVACRLQTAGEMPLAGENVGVELDIRSTGHGMLLLQRNAAAAILPGQQRIPAGRANRGSNMKLGEQKTLLDEPVELWRKRALRFAGRLAGQSGVAIVR